jgi:hypothetical protein
MIEFYDQFFEQKTPSETTKVWLAATPYEHQHYTDFRPIRTQRTAEPPPAIPNSYSAVISAGQMAGVVVSWLDPVPSRRRLLRRFGRAPLPSGRSMSALLAGPRMAAGLTTNASTPSPTRSCRWTTCVPVGRARTPDPDATEPTFCGTEWLDVGSNVSGERSRHAVLQTFQPPSRAGRVRAARTRRTSSSNGAPPSSAPASAVTRAPTTSGTASPRCSSTRGGASSTSRASSATARR